MKDDSSSQPSAEDVNAESHAVPVACAVSRPMSTNPTEPRAHFTRFSVYESPVPRVGNSIASVWSFGAGQTAHRTSYNCHVPNIATSSEGCKVPTLPVHTLLHTKSPVAAISGVASAARIPTASAEA